MTWHHASAFPLETGQLWLNVAVNKRNVIPILDFVITQGLQEAAEHPSEVSSVVSLLAHFLFHILLCICAWGRAAETQKAISTRVLQRMILLSFTAGNCVRASYVFCGQKDCSLPFKGVQSAYHGSSDLRDQPAAA